VDGPLLDDDLPDDRRVRITVDDDLHRSRLTVFFRLLLAIPHYFWISLIGVVFALLVFVNWFILLFVARTPQGIHDFLAGYIRYTTQLEAYVLLAANPYPPFWPLGEADYPVTLEIDPPARQSRWKTFFRLFLAIPAFAISGSLLAGGVRFGGYGFGIAFSVAFLVWWVALFLGRAPRGMRDLLGFCVGYGAQLAAYLFLVTDRYPYSGANRFVAPHEDDEPHRSVPVAAIHVALTRPLDRGVAQRVATGAVLVGFLDERSLEFGEALAHARCHVVRAYSE